MNASEKEVFIVKCGKRYLFLDLSSIDLIQAEGNYVRVFLSKDKYLVREKLSEIEKRLQNANFVRISRSVVVNIKSIRELQHKRPCNIEVTLHNRQRYVMTRKYRQNLNIILGKDINSSRTLHEKTG